ncbi:hypothetical protein PIL02S_05145 [Paenibacillus illinoisensis]|uniref:Uncharacterized protein n=1 Tax=Paenibacillus illinoisensis TaxID=59845 RepID=A0A2W0C8Z5_9BACL|nr:hypothetical protein PIL02S_05145 [Paenibacillus illinoisensis]
MPFMHLIPQQEYLLYSVSANHLPKRDRAGGSRIHQCEAVRRKLERLDQLRGECSGNCGRVGTGHGSTVVKDEYTAMQADAGGGVFTVPERQQEINM